MSLLEQDTIKKGRIDKNATKLAELDAGKDSGKYKIEVIYNNAVYARKSESSHLLGLYYLVF